MQMKDSVKNETNLKQRGSYTTSRAALMHILKWDLPLFSYFCNDWIQSTQLLNTTSSAPKGRALEISKIETFFV